VSSRGDVQAANAALSSEHSKVTPASPEAKTKVAEVLCVVAGGLSTMIEPGGVLSIDQFRTAGVASVLPAASVARTRNS
jgi:hypothetical protein